MINQASVADAPTSVRVRDLARRMGVDCVPSFADRWAASVTKMSGGEFESDSTDHLLVALRRAGRITPSGFAALMMAHHHERQQS